jgi:hypothetical protein
MDPIEQWLRADSDAGKAAAGNRLADEVRVLRAALGGVMTWINEHNNRDTAELWVMVRDTIARSIAED